MVARANRLRELEADFARAVGVDLEGLSQVERFKYRHASLMVLQSELLQSQMLSGASIDTNMLLQINQVVSDILPRKDPTLQIEWIDSCICSRCRETLDAEEVAKAKFAEEAANAPKPPPPPPAPPPAPDNVVKLPRSIHDSPLAPLKPVTNWWPPPSGGAA